MAEELPPQDIVVVGGGVNGAGIARDAAGRGLRVLLAERGDLGGATSSASSKLVHGGLRYLEHMAFRLVREALAERDVLLRSAPHIVWPLEFVLPADPDGRPAWLLRLGLLVYDNLAWSPRGRGSSLPRSRAVDLRAAPYSGFLRPDRPRGFSYADCWVDDARLVALCAVDAAARGATILPRTEVASAERADGGWRVRLRMEDGALREVQARAIVNAAGPWAGEVLSGRLRANASAALRLVKGSHVVVRRLHQGEHAFILQNDDGRIVFVIPYERDFTLIGTTDTPYEGDPASVAIDDGEIAYLCRAASRLAARPVMPGDVVWSYSGVRPLHDDGKESASAVSRDYVLELLGGPGASPLLSVFGGKITTFRRLAEHAMESLAPCLPGLRPAWTAEAALPGGDIPGGDFDGFAAALQRAHHDVPASHVASIARRHGTRALAFLRDGAPAASLGRHFGAGLYEAEIDFLRREEWARSAEDVLWRRTKSGLHLCVEARDAVAAWMRR
jgi:glycerol-3-phosphate dehydrogenase